MNITLKQLLKLFPDGAEIRICNIDTVKEYYNGTVSCVPEDFEFIDSKVLFCDFTPSKSYFDPPILEIAVADFVFAE